MNAHGTPQSRATEPPTGTWLRWLCLSGLLLALWLASHSAARVLEYAAFTSLWFPPAAVSFAGFIVFGWRAWPALLLANVLGVAVTWHRLDIWHGWAQFAWEGVAYGFTHCLPYWLLAQVTLGSMARAPVASVARTVAVFLAGGVLAALGAATGGIMVLLTAVAEPAKGYLALVLPWMIGDFAGLVALGPMLALVLRQVAQRTGLGTPPGLHAFDAFPRPHGSRRHFLFKLVAVLGSTTLALLAIAHAPDNEALLFIVFIAIVLQWWIVHTQSVIQSMLSIAAYGVLVALLVVALELDRYALVLQCAMITIAAGSYFGMAVPMLYADNTQLRKLLIHDSLTGAYNRHFFVEIARQSIQQARIRGQPAAMLMIDLDRLKAVNDGHGHAAGDLAIETMVGLCQKALRGRDVFGRLGGDEFAALLPDCGLDGARSVAKRIVQLAREARYPFTMALRPSLSIGIAVLDDEGGDYEALSKRADAAMYLAKRSGGNRVADAGGLVPCDD